MIEWMRRALPPSGGFFYHYLALRFSRSLWQNFCQDVSRWLEAWNPSSAELIIFGSSAGYSLPKIFLNRFTRVIVVEPDPLARMLLKRRFPKAKFEFEVDRSLLAPLPKDFVGSSSKAAVEKLSRFLSKYPNAAVLFANVLGQLPHEFPHLSDEVFSSHLIAIRSSVKGREWASYHDILSTWTRPKSLSAFNLPGGAFDLDEFIRSHLTPPTTHGVRIEVTDHQTHALSAGEPTQCSWWELAPGRFHLIGFLCAKPT